MNSSIIVEYLSCQHNGRCIGKGAYSTVYTVLPPLDLVILRKNQNSRKTSFPSKLGGRERVASAGYDRWSESLKFIDQNCIHYSGKYWQGFKFGSLAIFRKSTKAISLPAMYVSYLGNALGIKGLYISSRDSNLLQDYTCLHLSQPHMLDLQYVYP